MKKDRSDSMRKIDESELFGIHFNVKNKMEIANAINMKLNQNVGIISPDHISAELEALKIAAKRSYKPLLGEAISLYEQFNGRIKLFNLGLTSGGRSPIPPYLPFLFSNTRNKQLESEKENHPVSPTVLVNMYRIGHWSIDEAQYLGLSVNNDLYSCLESGLIAYKMIFENKAEKVFANKNVLEYLTNIYTRLFSNIVIKSAFTYGDDFNEDSALFIIAQFFLRYVLKKQPSTTIDDFAYKTIKHRTSLSAIKLFEESSEINYSTLSGFLDSLGITFFNEKIDMIKFQVNWASSYGEGLMFAIEYVPYLIHFLFATLHGALLGGSNRLINRQADLQKDGLPKVYNAIIEELR